MALEKFNGSLALISLASLSFLLAPNISGADENDIVRINLRELITNPNSIEQVLSKHPNLNEFEKKLIKYSAWSTARALLILIHKKGEIDSRTLKVRFIDTATSHRKKPAMVHGIDPMPYPRIVKFRDGGIVKILPFFILQPGKQQGELNLKPVMRRLDISNQGAGRLLTLQEKLQQDSKAVRLDIALGNLTLKITERYCDQVRGFTRWNNLPRAVALNLYTHVSWRAGKLNIELDKLSNIIRACGTPTYKVTGKGYTIKEIRREEIRKEGKKKKDWYTYDETMSKIPFGDFASKIRFVVDGKLVKKY